MQVRQNPQFDELPIDILWVTFNCIGNINNLLMLRLVNKVSRHVIDMILSQPKAIFMLLGQCRSQSQFQSLCTYLNDNQTIQLHTERIKSNRSIADNLIQFYLLYWNPDLEICKHPSSHATFFDVANRNSIFQQNAILSAFDLLPPKLMRSYINTLAAIRNVNTDACFATETPSLQYLYYALTVSDIRILDPLILRKAISLAEAQWPHCDIIQRLLLGLRITLSAIDPTVTIEKRNYLIKNFPSFIYVNLNNADVNDIDFGDCDLRYFSLIGTSFTRCQFTRSCLRAVNLTNSAFHDCHFKHSNFEFAGLINSDVGTSLFDHARFKGANFTNTRMLDTSFDQCHLDHVLFNNASLMNVRFNSTKMQNCSLRGAT